jgi:hypothetical protein
LEASLLAEPACVLVQRRERFVGIGRIAALDDAQRLELVLLRLGGLVELEQDVREAIEERNLILVQQSVFVSIDRARLVVCRHRAHVVVVLTIVVAERGERLDRERSEHPIERVVQRDRGEVTLLGGHVVARAALRLGEIEIGFRGLTASLAELLLRSSHELLLRLDDLLRVVRLEGGRRGGARRFGLGRRAGRRALVGRARARIVRRRRCSRIGGRRCRARSLRVRAHREQTKYCAHDHQPSCDVAA